MKLKALTVVTLALLSAAAIGLAACGGSGADSTSNSGSADITGTITVWENEPYPEFADALKKVDARFEKAHPGVEVKRETFPEEGFPQKVRAALISHEVPDVLSLSPGYATVQFAESLEPLNDRITPEMDEDISQWSSVTPGLAEEGERYAVPLNLNGAAFYYNKKLFAKAGLPTDFRPSSWQELQKTAEKLKEAGIQPFVDREKNGTFLCGWMFGMGLQTAGTEQQKIELAEHKVPYTEDWVAKAADPYIDMYKAGLYPEDLLGTEFSEGFTDFEEGQGAMVLGFWGLIGSFQQFDAALGEKNVGMFPTPGAKWAAIGTVTRSIPKEAKNKDGAWALIEFEASKKSEETFLTVGSALPTRTNVKLPADYPIQGKELMAAAANGETEVFPVLGLTFNGGETINSEFPQVVQGRSSVADMQQAIQEATEKDLSE